VSRLPLPSLIKPLHIRVAAGGMRRDSRGSWVHARLTCRRSSEGTRSGSGNGPLRCFCGSLKHGAFGHRSRQARTRVLRRIPNGMVVESRQSNNPGNGSLTPWAAGRDTRNRDLVSVGRLSVLKVNGEAIPAVPELPATTLRCRPETTSVREDSKGLLGQLNQFRVVQ